MRHSQKVQVSLPLLPISIVHTDVGVAGTETGPLRITEPVPVKLIKGQTTFLPNLQAQSTSLNLHIILAIPVRRQQLAQFISPPPRGGYSNVRDPRSCELHAIDVGIIFRTSRNLIVNAALDPDFAQTEFSGLKLGLAPGLGPHVNVNAIDCGDHMVSKFRFDGISVARLKNLRRLKADSVRAEYLLIEDLTHRNVKQLHLYLTTRRGRGPFLPLDGRHQSHICLFVDRKRQCWLLSRL